MTDDNLMIGGVPLADLLAGMLPELITRIIERLVAQLPAYGAMPSEELAGDISTITEASLKIFLDVLRTGEMPTSEQLTAARESAARRADEGVPIDAVLSAYHIGVQVCLENIVSLAAPEESAAVHHATMLVLRYLQLMTGAVAGGYFQQRQAISSEEHAARQALLAALLSGEPAAPVADRGGIRLPTRYLVLSLHIGEHPDELRAGVDSSVAARRKLRRVHAEFDRLVHTDALTMFAADGGIALISNDRNEVELSTVDYEWLSTVVSRLTKAAGGPVIAGVGVAAPGEVAQVAELCRELSKLATGLGRPAGVYQLADLILEYQLTRPSPARDALARLLDPLAGKEELLGTLRAYLASGLARRSTAHRLHVHPNTVDYRIRKVAELTGLDATRPTDLPRIKAALVAADHDQGVTGRSASTPSTITSTLSLKKQT